MHLRYGIFLTPIVFKSQLTVQQLLVQLDSFYNELSATKVCDITITTARFKEITELFNNKIKKNNLLQSTLDIIRTKWDKVNERFELVQQQIHAFEHNKLVGFAKSTKKRGTSLAKHIFTDVDLCGLVFNYLYDHEKAIFCNVSTTLSMYRANVKINQQIYLPRFNTVLLLDGDACNATINDLNGAIAEEVNVMSYRMTFFHPTAEQFAVVTKKLTEINAEVKPTLS